ncbi:F-box protein CPR1-like [Lycium barbarum]|uniref:F-box protein CPR1-like n=1 Tax=Lycium barbarum TaxID=112863 RepID=UPI00293EB9E5|nr:F-box protein CPR1-like [Lycium barbarum]
MEYDDYEAFYQHPKQSKPIIHSQLPSTSVKDSSFKTPILLEELITETLLRLPVKPLLKFKSVSKSWLSLISSPEFIKRHLSLSANNKDYNHHRVMLMVVPPEGDLKDYSLRSLLYDSVVVEASDMNYPVERSNAFLYIVGSINRLICFAESTKLLLWNPSIRKFKKLPDFRTEKMRGLNNVNSVIYGFGYDEIHDDYKVVSCMFSSYDKFCPAEVKIYSLKSDSWRSIHSLQGGVYFRELGKFVNGKLHWATIDDHHLDKGCNIISIDLACEKLGAVELPCYGEGNSALSLGVFESNLSMVCTDPRTHLDVCVVEVWVMKEYDVKESWTKMFTIKYPPVPVEDNFGHYRLSPSFCLSNTGEIWINFHDIQSKG